MEESYQKLLKGNQEWVNETLKNDPNYFKELAKGQQPKILWIGCSDSRVPANQITGTKSGEVFVHRNIANMVVDKDTNLLSVLDFAVNFLEVKHVIVCGHSHCGGIHAALEPKPLGGVIDNWLHHIKDVYKKHQKELDAISDNAGKELRLTELNIKEQVYNLCKTSIIQNSWKKRNSPHLHGWIYNVGEGLIKDLNVTVRNEQEMQSIYK